MDKYSRESRPLARKDFNRAADRRSEPRCEIYFRDVHSQTSCRDVYLVEDRKTGVCSSKE